ncbi:histone demethylase H3-K36 specific, Lid2 complex subunit Jmj3 [Schizosaccharomyces osmophilus]|uniref:Histone demethylase H3-K36 specific, Lid2 complex subunit Jmj3 n=1 Tax=Schizosaccharomyces osmophilus TaxID=2545709 RepID=A0AAE9W8W8_9SCHI|nr:histone demethylase H3-K36 specific, Lid2 complex subunit Jmj3 [Schizosaccharomyces osmophilus]WBW70971.1 histone demethylase H3-K36 specific, Lid2 complex subunit Jmj3 [Schizosaccharomyces osmophilus]
MQENDKSKPVETSDQTGERVSCKFEYVVEGADGIPLVKPSAEEFSDMEAFFQEIRDLGERYGAIKVLKPDSITKPWDTSSDGNSLDKKIDVWVEKTVRRRGEYFEIELVSDAIAQSNSKAQSTVIEPPKFENNISKAIAYYWRSLTHDNLWYGYSHHTDRIIFGIPSRRALESRVHLRSSLPENTWPTSGKTFAGKWKTTLPWRIESNKLYAVHVHLGGAPLQWYLIPSSQASVFQKLAEKLAPNEHWRCADFLLHQNILFPPSTLAQSGINISSTVLRANEMLITFPGSYHSAFCLGDTALRRFAFHAHDSSTLHGDIWSLGITESAFSSKSNWPHIHKPKKACYQDISLTDTHKTTQKDLLPLSNPFKKNNLQPDQNARWNGIHKSQNDKKTYSPATNSISSPSPSPSPTTEKDSNSTSLPLFTLWNSKFRSEFIEKSQEMTNSNIEFSQFEPVYLHSSNHPLFPPPILGLPVPAQFARGDVFWGRILEDRASERMLLLECGSSDTIEVPYEYILTSSSAAGRRSPSYYNPPLKVPDIIYDDGFPVNWNDFDELPSLDRFVLPELLPGNPIRFIPSTKPSFGINTDMEPLKANGTNPLNESISSDMEAASLTKSVGIAEGNVPTPVSATHETNSVSDDEIEQNTEDVLIENRSELLEANDDLEDRFDRLEELRRFHSQLGLEHDTQDTVSHLARRAPEDFSVSLETYELCVNEELEAVNDFSLFPSLE